MPSQPIHLILRGDQFATNTIFPPFQPTLSNVTNTFVSETTVAGRLTFGQIKVLFQPNEPTPVAILLLPKFSASDAPPWNDAIEKYEVIDDNEKETSVSSITDSEPQILRPDEQFAISVNARPQLYASIIAVPLSASDLVTITCCSLIVRSFATTVFQITPV